MSTTRYAMVPVFVLGVIGVCSAQAHSDSLRFRIDPMLVTPSHGPMLFVVVKNEGSTAREGTLTLKAPEGWLLSPKTQTIEVKPGEVGRFGFNVQRAKQTEENRYPLEVVFREEGKPDVTYRQDGVVATAPYFAPEIDGKTDDWKDAVPLGTATGEGDASRETVVRTFWSRRAFSILVEVEEDQLKPAVLGDSAEKVQYGDAVQLAFGAEKPGREGYEYLIVADGEGGGTCYSLEKEGDRVVWTAEEKAKCRVTRERVNDGSITTLRMLHSLSRRCGRRSAPARAAPSASPG